ncbi:hypothetical protein [Bacillus sp. B15-48]|uniref:hypothetical protein n=1 Tax=Bacillus sp. B15-48 TaxID=1548601 RepID=UPI0019401824|nr:hypothetical protein [Bacillus sp. B15-48]MBM4763601.1 hypothetical protein [Bacillus sp. B15-48]
MNYPVSEELREEMVTKVFRDFMFYALDQYDDEILDVLNEFVNECDPEEKKQQSLFDNLFWFKILYKSQHYRNGSCIEDYLSENYLRFRTRPFMASWLRECDKAVSKFYYIAHKENDRSLVAIDLLTDELIDVLVLNPKATPPKLGEIVAGTLLPLGDRLYFPVIDFYHFNYDAREAIGSCFHHHYQRYLKNFNMQDTFLHVFSIMLQIERMVSTEKH